MSSSLNGSQKKFLLEVYDQLFVLLVFSCPFLSELSQLGVQCIPAIPVVIIEEVNDSDMRMAVLPKLGACNTIRLTLLLWRAAGMPADIPCLLVAATLAHGLLLLFGLFRYD